MALPSPVTPRLSAAVMLLRPHAGDGGPEVFMVQRHAQSNFVPGVFVFPGGSVVASDREAELTAGVSVPMVALTPETSLGMGVRAAAIRELFEEAGVLLAWQDGQSPTPDDAMGARWAEWRLRLGRDETSIAEMVAAEDLVLATDALTYYAHWITPEAFPKRFSTFFFLAEMPPGQEAAHDAHETTAGLWVRPAEALARSAAGDFPLVFATEHQLRDLAAFTSVAAVLAASRGRIPTTIMPRVVMHGGVEVILMPGEADPV
jgi:8-oxo-dGTP pyrophosphatase MutT (NUDIX family)